MVVMEEDWLPRLRITILPNPYCSPLPESAPLELQSMSRAVHYLVAAGRQKTTPTPLIATSDVAIHKD